MAALNKLVGVRGLAAYVEGAAPGRVLDLHRIAMERAGDFAWQARPMFSHPILNRAIIAKHTLRSEESGPPASGRLDSTRIIFPFDPTDLDLGGHYLTIDERRLPEALADSLDYGQEPMARDLQVLRLVDALPTLDPFLLREVLSQRRIHVAACYFAFRPSEQTDMLDFVARELEALAVLCFGELKAGDARAQRMSRLLLADHSSPELRPLQLALRMHDEEFGEAMFAWKGFLYYRWKIRSLAPGIKTTRRAISRIKRGRASTWEDDVSELMRTAKAQIDLAILDSCRRIREALAEYEAAFATFTGRKDADSFRTFLERGSARFVDLGVRIGRLEQVVGYWEHQFGGAEAGRLASDEILDALRDVLAELTAGPDALIGGRTLAVRWEGANLMAVG